MAKAGVSQLTYADLQALPDDHNRYELIDGELLVSPSPNTAHQWAVSRLVLLLHSACPPGHVVFTAPYDWLVDDHNVFEPDVLVARIADLTERNLPVPRVLAVDVLSPSSRSRDLVRKRAAYERAGLGRPRALTTGSRPLSSPVSRRRRSRAGSRSPRALGAPGRGRTPAWCGPPP